MLSQCIECIININTETGSLTTTRYFESLLIQLTLHMSDHKNYPAPTPDDGKRNKTPKNPLGDSLEKCVEKGEKLCEDIKVFPLFFYHLYFLFCFFL